VRRVDGQGQGQADRLGHLPGAACIRTVASLMSASPEHNIRVIAPDIGGGFGNKVGAYPGYICAIVASIVTGVPVKWVEDRMENLIHHSLCPRLSHEGQDRREEDGTITGLMVPCAATTAASTPAPIRPNGRQDSSTSAPGPMTSRRPIWRSTASIPTRRRAASPIAVRSG
jgi:hypothetical protein